MFTTLTNWLRPANRTTRRPHRLLRTIETLEDRVVMDASYFKLSTAPGGQGIFQENWATSINQITVNNDWSNVPSVEGYAGTGLSPSPSSPTNPATITASWASGGVTHNQLNPADLSVIANQNDEVGLDPDLNQSPGGIAEFDGVTVPTVALAGNSKAQAPFLVFYMDTTGVGVGNTTISYTLVDNDDSSRNVTSQVALQYRYGTSSAIVDAKPWIPINAASVSDASAGPNKTQTNASTIVTLPAAANGMPCVQIRIITVNATGDDEWIGFDKTGVTIDANMPPVVTTDSTPITFTENDPITPVDGKTAIDTGITLADPDSADFQGGQLTVNYNSGFGTATDHLYVNDQSSNAIPGLIHFDSATNLVYYTDSTSTMAVIGKEVKNGLGTNDLQIQFTTGAATQEAVQALMRDICYENLSAGGTGDDPIHGTPQSYASDPTTIRTMTVQFQVSDGDGYLDVFPNDGMFFNPNIPAGYSNVATRTLNIFAVDDAPKLTINGTLTPTEQDPAKAFDPSANITDPDSTDFDGGFVNVQFQSGATDDDILGILNIGTGGGQIGVIPDPASTSKLDVTYGGVEIGYFPTSGPDSGLGKNDLQVTLVAPGGSGANLTSVKALLEAITFQNTSDNPPSTSRTVLFTVNDGDGVTVPLGSSVSIPITVIITPVNDNPVLFLSPSVVANGITYTENTPHTPVVLDNGVTVTDVDSPDFDGGTLTVDFSANGSSQDRLSILDQGPGPGNISFNSATGVVSYDFGTLLLPNVVPIGTLTSNGVGNTELQITFLVNPGPDTATPAVVQALARDITFTNVSDNPSTLPRTVRFVVTDGDGGSSNLIPNDKSYFMTVNVVAVNNGPTLANFLPLSNITIGSKTANYFAGTLPALVVSGAAFFTDPDSPTLYTASSPSGSGSLTVTDLGGLTTDVLAIRNQGTGDGKIGLNGSNVTYTDPTSHVTSTIGTFVFTSSPNPTLTITFNSTFATISPTQGAPSAAAALIRDITFKTPNGPAVSGTRTLDFIATDDQGASSNLATLSLSVASNAALDDDFFEINEDATLGPVDVLSNDAAGLIINTTPVQAPSNGTLIINANGTFTYTPNADWNGTDTFKYGWTNAAGSAQVTITVDPVNDPPQITLSVDPGVPYFGLGQTAVNSVVVNEDSGPQTRSNFASFAQGPPTAVTFDEGSQTLTTTISNNNNALFTAVGQPAIDANGKLTFTTAKDANGTAQVTIKTQDSGGIFGSLDQDTTTLTFTILVNAVNDQPSFTIPPALTTITLLEDAVSQSISNFATQYLPAGQSSATALDETLANQPPTYILTLGANDAPFSPTGKLEFAPGGQPAIDANGTLTFTLAPNSNGKLTISVQVNDNGGNAFGGQPLSASHTFTIDVKPVNDQPTVVNDSTTILWNSAAAPINVLANDSDLPDVGETISVVGTTLSATPHGSVSIQPGGGAVIYQPNPGFVGTDTFTYQVSDGNGGLQSGNVTVNIIRRDTTPLNIVALGSGVGGSAQVNIYDSSTGKFINGFTAFDPGFQGGVSVAVGDVNGDGIPDIIVGAGPGGGPRIEVVNGARIGLLTGVNTIANPAAVLVNEFVYDFNFMGGITVAAGDVDGDGTADVIVGAGPGGGPNVKVISGARINRIGPDGQPDPSAVISSFYAYDANFRGGVNVAAGDVNGDGYSDVITSPGAGGGSNIKAFSGQKLTLSPFSTGLVIASFYGFDPAFRGGVNIAAGDVNGDGLADFILGAGPGGGPNVKVYSPLNVASPIASFYAFASTDNDGVEVAYRARTVGSPLVIAGTGTGEMARIIAFAPPSYTAVQNIDAFDPNFMGGVSVG